jgi:hypothetical protein
MGIFKKSLAVVLAALMLISVFSVVAFAAEGSAPVVRGTLPNCDWDGNYDDANTMTEAGGSFAITYASVAAGDYQFKVVKDGNWYGNGDANFEITVSQESDLTISFDAVNNTVSFEGTYVSAKAGLDVKSLQVLGTVSGTTWSFADAAQMTENEGVWTVTLNNVPAGDYEYKFAANGSWDANWGGATDGVEDLSGDLAYNGKNFGLFFEGGAKDVTFKVDLSAFDFSTKTGATYEVTLADPAEETTAPAEETTAPAEETTAPAEETTAPAEETTAPAEETTAPAEETTAPAEETTAPVEPTEAPKPASPDTPDTPATPDTPDTPDTTPTTPAKPIVPGFYVVGSEEVCGAEWGWDKPWEYNEPMALSADGETYYQVFENIKASAGNVTDEGPDIYVFKVVYVSETGAITWHPGGMGNNTKVTVAEDGSTVFFQFKLLASRPTKEGTDPEAVIATVYGPKDEKPEDFSKVAYPETPEETTVAPTTQAPTEVEPTTAAPTTQPTTEKKVTAKKANTIKVKAKKVTVKAKKLKKKAQKVKITKALKVTKAKGTVTYAKVKKGSTKKFFKKVKIAAKSGKITIKKCKLKKGTYKLKIKVTAAGTKKYKKKSVSKVVKFKVR